MYILSPILHSWLVLPHFVQLARLHQSSFSIRSYMRPSFSWLRPSFVSSLFFPSSFLSPFCTCHLSLSVSTSDRLTSQSQLFDSPLILFTRLINYLKPPPPGPSLSFFLSLFLINQSIHPSSHPLLLCTVIHSICIHTPAVSFIKIHKVRIARFASPHLAELLISRERKEKTKEE